MANIDCASFGVEEEFWAVLPRRLGKRANCEDEVSSVEGYPVFDQCGRYARKERGSAAEIDFRGFFVDSSKARRRRAVLGTKPEGSSPDFLP
jgi:hypothetical protein